MAVIVQDEEMLLLLGMQPALENKHMFEGYGQMLTHSQAAEVTVYAGLPRCTCHVMRGMIGAAVSTTFWAKRGTVCFPLMWTVINVIYAHSHADNMQYLLKHNRICPAVCLNARKYSKS